jgi:phospholipid/cholesterol/gamma-HCH transport system ATP-binding protein
MNASEQLSGKKPIIEVKKLTAWYEGRLILDDINFVVYPGEIFFIIGGSGSGKTTVLRCIVGLHDELKGSIIVDGDDIVSSFGERKVSILRKIGIAYQSNALFGSMSLLENVMFPLEEFSSLPSDAIRAIAISKLNMVGLGDFGDYMPAELSGGMQKRAAIARAMVFEPKIIFLDEPHAALDPITAAQLDSLILVLAQTLKMTFVVVSHELASIFNIGQRVIMLHDKKIIAEGDPKKLRDQSDNEIVKNFFSRHAPPVSEKQSSNS